MFEVFTSATRKLRVKTSSLIAVDLGSSPAFALGPVLGRVIPVLLLFVDCLTSQQSFQ